MNERQRSFKKHTDRAIEWGYSLQMIADAIGCSYATVYAARVGRRNPPKGWQTPLADHMERTAKACFEMAGVIRLIDPPSSN